MNSHSFLLTAVLSVASPLHATQLLRISDIEVDENAGMAVFTCTLTHGAIGRQEYRWRTFDITAKENSDYVPRSGVLKFSDRHSETISIPLILDEEEEDVEQFGIRFQSDNVAGRWRRSGDPLAAGPPPSLASGWQTFFVSNSAADQVDVVAIGWLGVNRRTFLPPAGRLLAYSRSALFYEEPALQESGLPFLASYRHGPGSSWDPTESRIDLPTTHAVVDAGFSDSGVLAVVSHEGDPSASTLTFFNSGSDPWLPNGRVDLPSQVSDLTISRSFTAAGHGLDNDAAGSCTVWLNSQGQWIDPKSVRAPELEPGDRFGATVILANNVLYVGAPGDDEEGTDAGAIYQFLRTGGAGEHEWNLMRKVTLLPGMSSPKLEDESPMPLLMSRGELFVGTPWHGTGAVHVFGFKANLEFEYRGLLDASPPEGGTRFGQELAEFNDALAVSGVNTAGTHEVYVYRSNAAVANIEDVPVSVPEISVVSTSAKEGDRGQRRVVFDVVLSNPSPEAVSVSYRTADLEARMNEDYGPVSGILEFAPGATLQRVDVQIQGDTRDEDKERLQLILENPTGATVQRFGECTIHDDDPKFRVPPFATTEGDRELSRTTLMIETDKPVERETPFSIGLARRQQVGGQAIPRLLIADRSPTIPSGEVHASVPVGVFGNLVPSAESLALLPVTTDHGEVLGSWGPGQVIDLGIQGVLKNVVTDGFRTIVVSAPSEPAPAEAFLKIIEPVGEGGEWIVTKTIEGFRSFGERLALSGNTLMASDNKKIAIFERNAGGKGAWGKVAELPGEGCMSMSGDNLIVAREGISPSPSTVVAMVFSREGRDPSGWGLKEFIRANISSEVGSLRVTHCAMDGRTAVFAAPGRFNRPGFVFVSTGLSSARPLVASDGETDLGSRVAVSGDWIAVGGSEVIRMFQRQNRGWTHVQTIASPSNGSPKLYDDWMIDASRNQITPYRLVDGKWMSLDPFATSSQVSAVGAGLVATVSPLVIHRPHFAGLTVTDDDQWPLISLEDQRVIEGNDGSSEVTWTLPKPANVLLDWETKDGTAVAGQDYVASSGFDSLQSSPNIRIRVRPDLKVEGDEYFYLHLKSLQPGKLARNLIKVIITDDDESSPLVGPEAPARFLIPMVRDDVTGWTETGFDDALWKEGVSAFGYDRSGADLFGPLLGQDSSSDLYSRETSIFIRHAFRIPNPASIGQLLLKIRYNDGFVAYLNGLEVARSNVPQGEVPRHAIASASRPVGDSLEFESFDLSGYIETLSTENVLSIHGVNDGPISDMMLVDARLESGSFSSGFEPWATRFAFRKGEDAPSRDPDFDLLSNLVEYYLNTSPVRNNSPEPLLEVSDRGGYLEALLPNPELPPDDVRVVLQASPTLGEDSWRSLAAWTLNDGWRSIDEGIVIFDHTQRHEIVAQFQELGSPSLYLRLHFTLMH